MAPTQAIEPREIWLPKEPAFIFLDYLSAEVILANRGQIARGLGLSI